MDHYLTHIRNFNKQLAQKPIQLFNTPSSLAKIRPDAVVIAGMGGSGLPAELLLHLQDSLNLKVPVVIWKDYGLPTLYNNERALFIFVSFSGNTKETLSGLKQLLKAKSYKLKADVGIVTSGGELKRIALKEKLPFATFPAKDLTPREALGYTFFSLKLLLKTYFPEIRFNEFANIIKPAKLESFGRRLAREIAGKVPLIYTSAADSALGYVWKTSLNETAKNYAFANTIPEATHNEITAFGENRKKLFIPLFLTSNKTPKIIKKKNEIIAKVLKKNNIQPLFIRLRGKNKEEIAWKAVILSHFVAYYLAKLKKVGPQETRLIDQLKQLEK